MKKEKYVDPFLAKRITKYDKWLDKGQISFSSKVIPVSESFKAKQWVMPTEQVMELLRGAKSIALQNCECRTHYKRCENPLEVCLLLNEVGDKLVHCGVCADRCVFTARSIKDEKMKYNANECRGCGLCVTSCPAEAITMELRESGPKS